jgi:hypothetical protein
LLLSSRAPCVSFSQLEKDLVLTVSARNANGKIIKNDVKKIVQDQWKARQGAANPKAKL